MHNRSEAFKKDHKRIMVKHLTRIETIAAYREADLFLFPSNIEGGASIVLFESMAASLPFLATDVGSAKEIVSYGGGVLLPTEKDVPPEDTLRGTIKHGIKKIFEMADIGTFHSDRGYVRAQIAGSVVLFEELCHDKVRREQLGAAGHRSG